MVKGLTAAISVVLDPNLISSCKETYTGLEIAPTIQRAKLLKAMQF